MKLWILRTKGKGKEIPREDETEDRSSNTAPFDNLNIIFYINQNIPQHELCVRE
jgi:hypothetical protein